MKNLNCYWYDKRPNFGDLASFELMSWALSGLATITWATPDRCDVSAIGSILRATALCSPRTFRKKTEACIKKLFRRPLLVFGSGFMFKPESSCKLKRRMKIFALRGRYTLAELIALKALKCDEQDIPLGDPALLLPDIHNISRAPDGIVSCIPHYADLNGGWQEAFKRRHPEINIISPLQSPEAVMQEVARSRFVFSSSLHGLIVADAMGVPNQWVRSPVLASGGEGRDWMFKFNDYYSAFGLERSPCGDPSLALIHTAEQIPQELINGVKSELRAAVAAFREEVKNYFGKIEGSANMAAAIEGLSI